MHLEYWWLIPLAVALGGYGTLIGAGGGFVLMPILVLLYPDENRDVLASVSLAVVFFNAFSGSVAYARMKRIDYRSGMLFAAATVPGAVLGALVTSHLHRGLFDGILGGTLIAGSLFLFLRPRPSDRGRTSEPHGHVVRTLVDGDGTEHRYTYNPILGVALSLVVGFASSLLGVGGGFIHVPILVYLLSFPVHVATATSHFVLAAMALAGTIVHILNGGFTHGVFRTIYLAVGVVVGAQFGAALSTRIHGRWIIRGLALALALVGLRILVEGLLGK